MKMYPKRTIMSSNHCRPKPNNAQSAQNAAKKDELRCWYLRNNSLNVNKLLAPYIFDANARQDDVTSKSSRKICVNSRVSTNKRPSGGCLDCYCNDEPVLPKLNPKNFLNEEDYPNHLCDSFEDLSKSEEPLASTKNKNLCGDYADGRMERPIKTTYCCQSGDTANSESRAYPYNALNLKNETSPKVASGRNVTLLESLQKCKEAPEDLEIVNKFRNENFFDCHSSVDTFTTNIPEHKCIHKFVVNDRLLPEPQNCDAFGTSRCIICNLPMKTRCEIHRKYINPRSKSKRARNTHSEPISKYYTNDFTPKTVNISCGCEDVEVSLSNPNRQPSKTVFQMFEEMKRHTPKNSLALRFQKGVSK